MKSPPAGGTLTALLLATVCCATPAWAGLGGDIASIEADRAALKGALTTAPSGGYEIRTIATAGGGLVREYLRGDGTVFAVSWHAPTIPDLRVLLGSYYERYARGAAAASHAGGHRHFAVRQPGLVVESSGRLRAFSGRAWDPQLLPKNFSAADIN